MTNDLTSVEIAKTIKKQVLYMTSRGKSSHIGSCLSICDILTVLYKFYMVSNLHTNEFDRNRFILSKGHAGAALYATLAEFGYFNKELLETHYKNGSILSGHVSSCVPGVDISTGSLGYGLGIAAGVALGFRKQSLKSQVFVLISDGELNCGPTWEAIQFISHNNLNNLVLIVDYNKIQSLDKCANVLNPEPLVDRFLSFGLFVEECDGHDHDMLQKCLKLSCDSERPTVIIAHTTKGKGVSFMENTVLWHYRSPQGKEFIDALEELNHV